VLGCSFKATPIEWIFSVRSKNPENPRNYYISRARDRISILHTALNQCQQELVTFGTVYQTSYVRVCTAVCSPSRPNSPASMASILFEFFHISQLSNCPQFLTQLSPVVSCCPVCPGCLGCQSLQSQLSQVPQVFRYLKTIAQNGPAICFSVARNQNRIYTVHR
jgi:hypothetical protein